MAIEYKIYQNKNEKSAAFKKWFARPVLKKGMDMRQLANLIQQNVSAKTSDVYAVLMELPNAIHIAFDSGRSVSIEGLGSFRPSFGSVGVADPNDFSATNIRKKRVVFTPETTQSDVNLTRTVNGQSVTIQTRVRNKRLFEGIQFVENDSYQSPRTKPAASSNSTQNP